jgi:uncharacterized membrane protein SirB2
MTLVRTYRILDAAATLLGVALLIVTVVHLSGKSAETIADELSFVAAILFIGSCLMSHRGISKSDDRFEQWADRLFALALLLLLCGVLSFWF